MHAALKHNGEKDLLTIRVYIDFELVAVKCGVWISMSTWKRLVNVTKYILSNCGSELKRKEKSFKYKLKHKHMGLD